MTLEQYDTAINSSLETYHFYRDKLRAVLRKDGRTVNARNLFTLKLQSGRKYDRLINEYNNLSHYQLELRCIVSMYSALIVDAWSRSNSIKIDDNCADFIDDLTTVANTLGYNIPDGQASRDRSWRSGALQTFEYSANGTVKPLFTIRGYYNGNLHIKFDKHFLIKLSVEFGRIKGWLRSKEEAAKELNISETEVQPAFKSLEKIADSPQILTNLLTVQEPQTAYLAA